MELDNFAKFEKDTQERILRVQKVGEICLSPEANKREYILATIDTLHGHLGRPATVRELNKTLWDVVKYRLWDVDNDESRPEPIIGYTAAVHVEINHTLANLSSNGWISPNGPMELTYSGRQRLNEFIPATESTVF